MFHRQDVKRVAKAVKVAQKVDHLGRVKGGPPEKWTQVRRVRQWTALGAGEVD